jgi:cardiolipin-specific phospholipase
MSVAYAERYPTRVERLILISPVGVPDHQDPNVLRRMESMQSSFRGRAFLGLFQTIFEYMTPGGILRTLTESRGSTMARNYIERRLPEISDVDESQTVADYLYWNAALPPSGESFLQSVLTPAVLAKEPLLFRIPNLKVKSVTFMYGSTDWMDVSGGMYTQGLCEKLSEKDYTSSSSSSSATHHIPPKVDVFVVPKAGHLLILQNPEATNACMIYAAGGKVLDEEMPTLMKLSKSEEELNESWIKQTLKLREGKADDTILHEDGGIKTALKLNTQQ